MSELEILLQELEPHFIGLWISHHVGWPKTWAVTVCVNGQHFDTAREHDSAKSALLEAAQVVRNLTHCARHEGRLGSNGVCYPCQKEAEAGENRP